MFNECHYLGQLTSPETLRRTTCSVTFGILRPSPRKAHTSARHFFSPLNDRTCESDISESGKAVQSG